MSRTEIKSTVKEEMDQLNRIADNVKRASHHLDGSSFNSWHTNNSAVNEIMTRDTWTDINGDDVTSLVRDDIVDNYGLEDTNQAIDNVQSNINDEKSNLDKYSSVKNELKDDQISLRSLENNVHDNCAENHGFSDKYNTNNYFTDVTAKSVLAWINDIKKIIHADDNACAEAQITN